MTVINQIWDFFASVKLAIFTLCTLAITSIIGTVIPQGENTAFYINKYGPKTAQFMRILDIPEMYYSWWFLGLLGVLSCNLIICSFDRFPRVWKMIHADNMSVPYERLEKMSSSQSWSKLSEQEVKTQLPVALKSLGWNVDLSNYREEKNYFFEKGKWSRTGVYIVHLSILVIFVGAIVGHLNGFKASVMIPELNSTAKVFSSKDQKPIELGFEVRCNSFAIDFYENGMPKEYESSLTILEDGKEILTKNIEVNGPLTYRGITFYQSSYQGYKDFVVTVEDQSSKIKKILTIPFQQKRSWAKEDVHIGIVNAEAFGQRVVRAKVWIKIADEPAVIEWIEDNKSTILQSNNKEYKIHAKQMYATGLQVAKDPGVWIVYVGCGLMLIGLYMAFFMSHMRIWLHTLYDNKINKTTVLLAGNANKNRVAFAKKFNDVASTFSRSLKKD